jgi:hypothetical protein
MIDYEATGLNDTLSWLGPFLACPENEVVDAFEVNFSFPNGICGFDNKGKNASGMLSGRFSIGFMAPAPGGSASRAIRAQKH